MKYKKLSGIILKKQNYKETDQFITIWTPEAGKIRILARGVRLPKSKLAYSLQDLSYINFETVGNIHTIISAQVIKNFKGIRSNLAKIAPAIYASEVMLKTTADEQSNPEAFRHFLEFLHVLDKEQNLEIINVVLNSFVLKLLDCLGFSAQYAEYNFKVSSDLNSVIQKLRKTEFEELGADEIPENLVFNLKSTLNQILEFILERELKSENFLKLTHERISI